MGRPVASLVRIIAETNRQITELEAALQTPFLLPKDTITPVPGYTVPTTGEQDQPLPADR